MAILAEVENQKHQHLLNALSTLVTDPVITSALPDLVDEISATLAQNNIQIPSRPVSGVERPVTGSSQASGRR